MSKLQEARELTFKAQDASNLDEAIQCYVNYGELPVSGDIEEFWESYSKAVSSLEEAQNGLSSSNE